MLMQKNRAIYLNGNFIAQQYSHFTAGQKAVHSIGNPPFYPLKETELPRVF